MIFVNSLQCGGGKTQQIINQVLNCPGHHLIVQPSIALCLATKQQIPNALVITSDSSKQVVKDLMVALTGTKPIITTHAALLRFPCSGWNLLSRWRLHLDESIENVYQFHTPRLTTTNKIKQDLFKVDDEAGKYYKVSSKTKDDLIDSKYSLPLQNKGWDVHIQKDHWERDTKNVHLHMIFNGKMLKEFDFVSYYSATADLTEHRPSNLDLMLWDLPTIITTPFCLHHTPNLTLKPIFDFKRDNPSHCFTSITKKKNHEAHIKQYLNTKVGGNALFLCNNSDPVPAGVNLLSHNPHGLNNLTHINEMAITSVIRANNEQLNYLREVHDIKNNDWIRNKMFSLYYQTIMRGALRQDQQNKMIVHVPDLFTAMALRDYFFDKAVIDQSETRVV